VSRQRLGQHFLVKGSILDRIAAAACPRQEALVVEIGPGKGALTERLLARAGKSWHHATYSINTPCAALILVLQLCGPLARQL